MNQFNQKTGEMIISQSKAKIERIFSNLSEVFVEKNSGRYQKFKVVTNSIN